MKYLEHERDILAMKLVVSLFLLSTSPDALPIQITISQAIFTEAGEMSRQIKPVLQFRSVE